MSDLALIAVVSAVPGTLAALTGLLNAFLSVYHARLSDVRKDKLQSTVEALEKNTNNKMDQLLKAKDDLREASNKDAYQSGGDAARADLKRSES